MENVVKEEVMDEVEEDADEAVGWETDGWSADRGWECELMSVCSSGAADDGELSVGDGWHAGGAGEDDASPGARQHAYVYFISDLNLFTRSQRPETSIFFPSESDRASLYKC